MKTKAARTPAPWSAGQVVAYNLTKARELRGFTQQEVAELLAEFTGSKWTKTTVSQAENSLDGTRIRSFTANEIVALSRCFDLPIPYFFAPPENVRQEFGLPDVGAVDWDYLTLLLLGHQKNVAIMSERFADSPVMADAPLRVGADAHRKGKIGSLIEQIKRRRGKSPVSELYSAIAFHQVRLKIRGNPRPGDDLTAFVENLRDLAWALERFNNSPVAEFIDPELARRINEGSIDDE